MTTDPRPSIMKKARKMERKLSTQFPSSSLNSPRLVRFAAARPFFILLWKKGS